MGERSGASSFSRRWETVRDDPNVRTNIAVYADVLPPDKLSKILDIGFGEGDFIAAAVALGYTHIEGADFGASNKRGMLEWSPSIRHVHEITDDIGTFLQDHAEQYDFIHFAHVIEHIPKHSLLYNVDALYRALKTGGSLVVRTPNMEGPKPISSYFVTLGHEYGFSGSNLQSLLLICNFDDIRFVDIRRLGGKFLVRWIRAAGIAFNHLLHRLFGAGNVGGQYGEELVAIARRLNRPALFDPATR